MISLLRRYNILLSILILLCGNTVFSAQGDTLHFSFSNGIGKRGVTYAISLFLNDSLRTSDSLLAGEFTITHNGNIFSVIGIQRTGTLLSAVTDVQFNAVTGKVTFANAQPITGKGLFLKFLVTLNAAASGTTPVSLQNILLNEGNKLGMIANGSMRPMDIFINPKNPPQDRIVGDTVQFSVTGDVNFPVTWSVGDTHIVSINSFGKVVGKNVGQTTVTVVDSVGLTDQSLLLPIHPQTLRSLTVTIKDTSVMQNLTFLLPINVTTVSGLGIISAQFRLSYNPSLLVPMGIVQNGSLSQSWAAPSVFFGNGYADVAMAGVQALKDSGAFVFVQFKVKRFANFSSGLNLSNVLFNENISASVNNGIFTPVIGPVITISGKPVSMIRGETALLSVSGGTAPYTWKVFSDTLIAKIDSSTGTLFAKKSGIVVYGAIDANGFDGIDSLFIRDVRFTFPDTTLVYNDSIDYPISVSSLTGQAIVSAECIIPYDTAKIKFISVITTGTMTNGMLAEVKDSAGIRIALAVAAPLSGSGTFIKVRFKTKGLLSFGHIQSMGMNQVLLNENGPTNRTTTQKTGSITIVNVPNMAPVFTKKLRDTTIAENQLLQFQMTAFDPNGDAVTYSIVTGSPGMNMTGSGVFSWQPNFNQAGSHTVVYDVGDFQINGVTKDSAIITVTNTNRSPVFTRVMGDSSINENQLLTFDVDAVDTDNDQIKYLLQGQPAGMTLDSVTGILNWRPNFSQSGNYTFTVFAKDPAGAGPGKVTNISVGNVNRAPFFTQTLPDTIFVAIGQTANASFTGSDPDNDVISFTIVEAPAGAVIGSGGNFSWKPGINQIGKFRMIISVSDGAISVNDTLYIRAFNTNSSPVFSALLPDTTIKEGQQLSFTYKAIDAENDTLAWFLGSSVPQGLTVSSNGLLNWTPNFTQAGKYAIVVGVRDKQFTILDTVTITVLNVNRPPFFTKTLNDTTINEDQLLVFDVDAIDPDGDVVHYYIQNILPGMNIDTNSGITSWKPTFSQSGVYNISFVANDGLGGFANDSVTITVMNVNRPPFFNNNIPDTIFVLPGQTVNALSPAVDPDNDMLTYGLVQSPAGMTIDQIGKITWTPTSAQAGKHRTIVSVSDGIVSVNDTLFFRVTVTNTPPVVVTSLPDTAIAEGQLLSFSYKAIDAEFDSLIWTLRPNTPAGVTLSSNGLLNWTPNYSQAGKYTIGVSVRDKEFSVLDTAIVTVLNTNRAPQFTTILRDTTIYADSVFSFFYKGTDIDGDSILFSFIKSPAGASISSAGMISWTPTRIQSDTLIVALSDKSIIVIDTSIITVTGFPKVQSSLFEIDFGTTIFGSLPTVTAVIKNVGRIPLILKRMTGLPNEQHFTSNAPSQINVPVNQEVTIACTFTPQQIGSHTSAISFQTNDPKQQLFGFIVKGTAISVAPVKRKILVDLMHGSSIPLKDSAAGMTQLFGALRNSGMDVAFAETTFALSGYDALLIVTPQKEFSANEKTVFRQFVNDGGSAVIMGNSNGESNNTAVSDLLRDSLLASGLDIATVLVADSLNNYGGNPSAPVVTKFIDTKHPYLNGVDTLVFFRSTVVLTDSTAVPFARITSPSIAVSAAGFTNAAIGLKKIGKGSLLLFGDATMWQNASSTEKQLPMNIAANDNFKFALNVFSVQENYEVKMPDKTPNEIYQLVSIPFDLENLDILSVLKASLGDINPLKWRLFGKYDPATQKYREFPSAGFTTFTRGEAYWLITRGEFSVNFGSTTILPAQDYYPIKIKPGYSMIGNPFPYKVSWKNSRKGDSVQTVLWKFSASTNKFVPESLYLDPFAGYFVKNVSNDSVTILINPRSEQLPKEGKSLTFADNEWRIRIGGSSGKANDDENYAGVALNARNDYDRLDIAEPPTTPTDYLMVRFTNPDWKKQNGSYAVDIHAIPGDGTFWDFDVTTAKAQSKVQLKFDQFGNLPVDFSMYVVDKTTERATRLDKSHTIDVTMIKNETRHAFRLLAGKQDFIEKNTNGIPLVALNYSLGQNYPNPFNPTTFISYSLAHSGNVQLEIYNVLGQKVRVLRNENQPIGMYSIEWNGKDETNQNVASGVYFYKVTVINNGEKLFANTKKMVLMR